MLILRLFNLAITNKTKVLPLTPATYWGDYIPRLAYVGAPFPQTLIDAIILSNNTSLETLNFNQGLQSVFANLGWKSE